ncbi:MAG TPA: hypothetical protein VIP11_13160 [Gemmatimonadaceae bacterium]
MLVRPLIGGWSPPCIERIASFESRRLAVLPVPGLSGDLHQDMGRGALAIEIVGSLATDETRDQFLKDVREKFLAGEPVDFVADIAKESELEQVLIEELRFEEIANDADMFRYRIVLREYTEPPEPPAPSLDLGAELGLDLDALAALGLDALDLPALLGEVPEVGEILEPLKPAAESLKEAVSQATTVFEPLKSLFGE